MTTTQATADRRARTSRARLLSTLRIQYPDVVAARGYRLIDPETGDFYTDDRRHLVATCRSIANFAAGVLADGPNWCVEAAEHGLSFLREAHKSDDGGYRLVVKADGTPVDRTRSAYGHAFVLLAYARATAAGIDGAREGLAATHALIDDRFRDAAGLLRSDCDADWTELEPYRGQNANMHACEAYIAAYEATDEKMYLDRARNIAEAITVDLAADTDGLLWEHYTTDWDHDFGYNADEPRHQFRPPGYQPGHHAEWAKFLALLDRYGAAVPSSIGGDALAGAASAVDADAADTTDGDAIDSADGWYGRALDLFDAAIAHGWAENGFIYTHRADGSPLVADRYGWALAEGIGAAAALTERAVTRGDEETAARLRNWHRRLRVCTDLFRGPAGVWYEKRLPSDADGDLVAPEPPGVEPDYHPASASFESWRSARAETDETS